MSESHSGVDSGMCRETGDTVKAGALVPCTRLKEIHMVAHVWKTWDNKWEFVELTGGVLWGKERRDMGRISQNSVNKGPNPNIRFPLCCEIILSAAWCVLWDHKLRWTQFCLQKAVHWRRIIVFTFSLWSPLGNYEKGDSDIRHIQTHRIGQLLITDGNVRSANGQEGWDFKIMTEAQSSNQVSKQEMFSLGSKFGPAHISPAYSQEQWSCGMQGWELKSDLILRRGTEEPSDGILARNWHN